MKMDNEYFNYFMDDCFNASLWAAIDYLNNIDNLVLNKEYHKKVNDNPIDGEVIAYILKKGGSITIMDAYNDLNRYQVTKDDIEKGFQLLKKNNREMYDSLINDIPDYNNEVCDLLLQYVVFGYKKYDNSYKDD